MNFDNKVLLVIFLVIILILFNVYISSYADITPIEERTSVVQNAIVAALSNVDSPDDVTETHLAEIDVLYINQSTKSLKIGDFDGLTELKELNINLPQLDTLPNAVFYPLTNLTLLSITGTQLTSLPTNLFVNLSELKYLALSKNQLQVIPVGIFDRLKNLTVLDLRNNQLDTLPDGIFDHLINVNLLYLGNNKLEVLPNELFEKLTSLLSLDLSYNRLQSLDAGCFDKLSLLNNLFLSGNRLSSLPSGIFDKLTGLTSLYLSENRFSVLPTGIFRYLNRLTTLDLSANRIDPLPLNILLIQLEVDKYKVVAPTGAPFTILLPLSITKGVLNADESTTTIPIGSLESEPFDIYARLQEDAAIVDILSMPDLPPGHKGYQLNKQTIKPSTDSEFAISDKFVNIPDVNLQNKISATLCKPLGEAISEKEMSTLTSLFAEDAGISNLTGLEAAKNLTALYLGNNTISDITPLAKLEKLTDLQLRHNRIVDISPIAELTNLSQLFLSTNDIATIDSVELLPNLTHLYLNDNDINDISAIASLLNLTELGLANNNLSNIAAVTKLTHIVRLDVSDNNITTIAPVQHLTRLKELYLQRNNISILSPLTANIGLDHNSDVNVRGNALQYSAIYTDIPNLQNRGLRIDYDPLTVTKLVKVLGDTQEGNTGTILSQPFIVEVLDQNNKSFPGVPLTFTIASGIGRLSVTETVTDANGRAESTLTLGDIAGTTTIHVNIPDSTLSTSFSATASKIVTAFTPVNKRTPQVRATILDVLSAEFPSISTPADITDTHLASIKALYLNNKKITALQSGDFDGLTGLKELRLNNNLITTLPTGIFDDLSALTNLNFYNNRLTRLPSRTFASTKSLEKVRLGKNAVNPLSIPVFLEKVGDGEFRAVIPTGAMFNIVLTPKVNNGNMNGLSTTLTIPQGRIYSETRTVTQFSDNTEDVTVGIETLPNPPGNHYGYTLVDTTQKSLMIIQGTNTAPIFIDGTTTKRLILENTAPAVNIGTPVTATDVQNDTLTYTLSGTHADIFSIDHTTGQLKTKETLDYETQQSYKVTLTVSDGQLSDTIDVIINIVDIKEISESAAICKIGDVIAPGGSCIYPGTDSIFSVNQKGFGQFLFYTAEKKLTLSNSVVDGETYTLTAEKLENGSWQIKDVVNLNSAPKFTEQDNMIRYVQENSATGTSIGNPIVATDADGDVLRYSLSNHDAEIFEIDSNGQLKTKVPLDYETKQVYSITITVDDGHLLASISCIISVVDTDDTTITVGIVPVTERTPQVRDAIVAAVPGIRTASAVTTKHLSKIVSLNLRQKQISSLKSGDFSGLTALTHLNLYYNELVSLPNGIFDGLTALKSLRLGKNVIDPFPLFVSLQQVTEDQYRVVMPTGAPFTTTVPINLSNDTTKTVIIPKGKMASSSFTASTPRKEITIGKLPNLPLLHYGYILTKSTVCSRTKQVREAIVDAIPNIDDCKNVTDGYIETLTTLNLSDRSITSLDADDFSGMLSLRTLHLDNNSLTSLPDGIFDDLVSLRELYLNNNSLESLQPSLFRNLTSLTHLNLYNNSLRVLSDGIFDGLSSLKSLNLSENQLDDLSANIFDAISGLTSLKMTQNQFTSLPENSLAGFISIEELQLKENTVDPLLVGLSLQKIGTGIFEVLIPIGAPFEIHLPITVVQGNIANGVNSVDIPKGAVKSRPITIARTPCTVGNVTVDIGKLPSIPETHNGYILNKPENSSITVIGSASTAPLFATGGGGGHSYVVFLRIHLQV